jgi:hypothetical protein
MMIVIIVVVWLAALALVIALGTAAKAGDEAEMRHHRMQLLRRLGRLSLRAQRARAGGRRPRPPLA